MMFSLDTALIQVATKVIHENEPVAYSWGSEAALHQWIEYMNKKQINKSLGITGSKKYPLIWLVEGWKAKKNIPGWKFDKVAFYIAYNSKIEIISEKRVPNFEILYKAGNDFINQLKLSGLKIAENSIEYSQKGNFSVKKGKDGKTISYDVWDALIVEMELIANTNCLKKLCSL